MRGITYNGKTGPVLAALLGQAGEIGVRTQCDDMIPVWMASQHIESAFTNRTGGTQYCYALTHLSETRDQQAQREKWRGGQQAVNPVKYASVAGQQITRVLDSAGTFVQGNHQVTAY